MQRFINWFKTVRNTDTGKLALAIIASGIAVSIEKDWETGAAMILYGLSQLLQRNATMKIETKIDAKGNGDGTGSVG